MEDVCGTDIDSYMTQTILTFIQIATEYINIIRKFDINSLY